MALKRDLATTMCVDSSAKWLFFFIRLRSGRTLSVLVRRVGISKSQFRCVSLKCIGKTCWWLPLVPQASSKVGIYSFSSCHLLFFFVFVLQILQLIWQWNHLLAGFLSSAFSFLQFSKECRIHFYLLMTVISMRMMTKY